MSAIWMRARSELRGRWRAVTALILIVGVAAGVVMTAAAGARRTESAYPRFVAWANPPDAGFNVAIATVSCRGTSTSRTIVRTRSIMRDALPARTGRSATRQTPCSTTQSVP